MCFNVCYFSSVLSSFSSFCDKLAISVLVYYSNFYDISFSGISLKKLFEAYLDDFYDDPVCNLLFSMFVLKSTIGKIPVCPLYLTLSISTSSICSIMSTRAPLGILLI